MHLLLKMLLLLRIAVGSIESALHDSIEVVTEHGRTSVRLVRVVERRYLWAEL